MTSVFSAARSIRCSGQPNAYSLICSCIICLSVNMNAQKSSYGYIPPLSVNSPQTADMIRYDMVPVDLYSGRISLEVPLVHISDKDFDFPVSLRYNSGGFKPADPDNIVGRNWMLNCGGLVYREINGVPDEVKGYHVGQTDEDDVDGFRNLLGSKNAFAKDSIKTKIYGNPYDFASRYNITVNVSTIPGLGNGMIESSADLYHFSFGEYSGNFMIGFDGKVSSVTVSGKECTVDLSEYKIVSDTNPYNSKIKITSADGYTYVFGGRSYGSMEYTALSWENDFPYGSSLQPVNPHQINAYYLTSIVAPSGRELDIYYRDIDKEYHINPYIMTLGYNQHDADAQLQYSYMERSYYCRTDIYPLGLADWFIPEPVAQRSLTKTVMIDRVETDLWTVNFYYSKRGNLPAASENKQFPEYCGAKLDKVVLTSSDKRVEESVLRYSYYSGNRMFLREVTNTESGTFSFEYNNIEEVFNPTLENTIGPRTTNIDNWGYWRGSKKSGKLFPKMKTLSSVPYDVGYELISDDRQPTGDNVDATLLKKVIFPTGGSSVFEYEPNYWSSCRSFSFNLCIPSWGYSQQGQKELSGGARIKTVKYYDKAGKVLGQRRYDYKHHPEGEINFMPLYRYTGSHWDSDKKKWIINGIVRKSDGLNWKPMNYDITGYTEVKEFYDDYTDSASFYKITSFASQHSYGDVFPIRGGIDPGAFCFWKYGIGIFPTDEDGYMQRYNANLGMKPMCNGSSRYGKILKESYYSSDNVLLREDNYEYKMIGKDTVYNIYSFPPPDYGAMVGVYEHIGTEILYRFMLSEKQSVEYFSPSGKTLRESVEYEYDKDGYLLSEILGRNGNRVYRTDYTYTHEYQVPPDKVAYSVTEGVPELVYEEKYSSYKDGKGFWRVYGIDIGNGAAPLREVSYDYYDDYGNPGLVRTRNGMSTVYVWGYHGQYLMAKIENASYDDVSKALEGSPKKYSSCMYSSDFLALETLRETLPDAHVTTYMYSPQIGVTSITSPNGRKHEYKYDEANRFIRETLYDDIGVSYIWRMNSYNIINM